MPKNASDLYLHSSHRADASLLGLISDTHGLLRPEALSALQGCDLIIHAGDVGAPEILVRLSELASVIAVRGNVDTAPWAAQLPTAALVETPRARIYVLHDAKQFRASSVPGTCDIVVSGHSHKPGTQNASGILFVNPGSAGPRRFKLPVTAARLNLLQSPPGVEFVQLL